MPNTPFTEHAARLTRDLIGVLVSDGDTAQIAARVAAIADELKEATVDPSAVEIVDSHRVQSHIHDDTTPASSPRNPIAPPMYIERDGDESYCETTLPRQYQGPPERVHGGIVALLLDQVLGHAAHAEGRPRAFTHYLNIEYHAATPIGAPLMVRGRIASAEGRKRFLSGEILCGGEVTVTAKGLWVSPRGAVEAV